MRTITEIAHPSNRQGEASQLIGPGGVDPDPDPDAVWLGSGSTLLILTGLLLGATVAWRRSAHGPALLMGGLAVLPAWTLASGLPWWALVVVGGLVLVAGWSRFARSAGVVGRWSARSRRKSGMASTWDIWRRGSGRAMRARAGTVRPSLSWWGRRRLPVGEVAVLLCRVGVQRVWSSVEDVTLVFGGPRMGKSGWLAGRVLDAPGAVLATSTRTDLYQLCAPLRAKRGPVFVFNAVGLADIDSTITFDPLTGCGDPVTATERATDMIAATSKAGSGDREYWDAQARRVLSALLHAAALGGRSMRDVLGWVANPDLAAREVPALLRRSGVGAFEQDVTQFVATNDRTRTSITSSIMPALGWLTHPAAAATAHPGHGFDVAELLESRAAVFLLGAEETLVAPLVCALTGHIAREARRLAALEPNGRLDPPLSLVLDEAALISPVPLQSWTADMGGRGVTIVCAFQSRAQLLSRWGVHDTATILNNAGAVMVFGNTKDQEDLRFWSTLVGDRDEPVATTDPHGQQTSRSVRRVPILQPSQIAGLAEGRVLVIRRSLAPMLGRAPMAWRRWDVRADLFTRRHPVMTAHLQQATTTAAGYRKATAARVAAVVAAVRGRVVAAGWAVLGWWGSVLTWWDTHTHDTDTPTGPDQVLGWDGSADPTVEGDVGPGQVNGHARGDGRPGVNGVPAGRWTR